ncbi:MAG: hypothetical protein H7Z38_21615 [Rubrivivax sp.]|nr:hypothetical protein [Pyrinomonadaceae bacterium]
MTQYLYTPASSQEHVAAPEIRHALRTATRAHRRLEDEFEPFGWTERCDLAAELRDMLDETPVELRGLVLAAEFMLESEGYTFDGWEERLHASNLISAVISGLHQIGGDAR